MLIAQEVRPSRHSKVDSLSFIILQVFLFLVPVFFIPTESVPFQMAKNAFMIYGAVALFTIWLIGRLQDGIFSVPKSFFYASSGLVAVFYTLAAIFSGNPSLSFFGQGLELGTVAFFVPSLVFFALIPLIIKTKERVFYCYATMLASFLLVGTFHSLRFVFGTDALSFGLFSTGVSNVIGRWSDVGIFFGLAALLSSLTLERVELSRIFRILVNTCFFMSIGMLVVTNFWSVWIVLALTSLLFFVHGISLGRGGAQVGSRKILPYSLTLFLISTLFLFAGNRIGSVVSPALGLTFNDARPSLATTFEVARESLAEKPIFGAGPNRFSFEWLLHKPTVVNQSVFWNVDFNYGVGLVPTLLVTSGSLGFLAVLAFLVLLVFSSVKALLKQGASPFSRYLLTSSFVGALYLWSMSFIYVPSPVIWILTMLLSGLLVSSLREDGAVTDVSMSTLSRPSHNFISVLLIVFAFIGTLSFGYAVAKKAISATYFQKASIIAQEGGEIDSAEKFLMKAMRMNPGDLYARALSSLYLARINQLFSDEKVSEAEAQNLFQSYLALAIQAADQAVLMDGKNYLNHTSRGQVFEAIMPLKIEGSYEEAKKSYESALALNPENPEMLLFLARIEALKGDNATARTYIAQALEKKGDYAAAVYLLAQIQIGEKNVPEAIRSVEAVATLFPDDPGVFFQLGLLYYNQKQYENAVLAFGRSVAINPLYADARYLLGLSQYEVEDVKAALLNFRELEQSNPDNPEIKSIIANLESGKAPLATPSGQLPQLPARGSSVSGGR